MRVAATGERLVQPDCRSWMRIAVQGLHPAPGEAVSRHGALCQTAAEL
jgi:hypothetical protein